MNLDVNLFKKPILIIGLIRNGENVLAENIIRLREAVTKFSEVHWLLIESDSSDNTVGILKKFSEDLLNFRYLSQGNLSEKMPLRTERLAFCRNIYLQEIRNNPRYEDVEYVIVSDFDDTNALLTEESMLSCWQRDDWDVCAANQLGPYFDIWALRHHVWSPGDCWLEHRFLSQFSKQSSELIYACIFSKMITLPKEAEWIEVDSAFGGLAIYKKSIMSQGNYIGQYDNGIEVCEHVPFHFGIRQRGGKIFINPRLINTDYTEHSLPLKSVTPPI